MPVVEISFVSIDDRLHSSIASSSRQAPPAAPPAELPLAPPLLARYTRSLLRQTLQLMGQKPRQSDKAAQKAFLILQQRAALPPTEPLSLASRLAAAPGGHAGVTLSRAEFDRLVMDCLAAAAPPADVPPAEVAGATAAAEAPQAAAQNCAEHRQQAQESPPHQHEEQQRQHRTDQQASAQPQLAQPQQRTQNTAQPPAQPPLPLLADFRIACALREQRASVAILLCGTSGTGGGPLGMLPHAASALPAQRVMPLALLQREPRLGIAVPARAQASRRWRRSWRRDWASPPSCPLTLSAT